MMFSIHGAEKIGGRFILRFGLLGSPVHEEAVAEAAKHTHDSHGAWLSHSALIVQVGNIQPLVQPAFNAPGRPVIDEPLRGIQLGGRQTGHQGHRFGSVVTQVAAQQSDLLDAGKVDLFGRS